MHHYNTDLDVVALEYFYHGILQRNNGKMTYKMVIFL